MTKRIAKEISEIKILLKQFKDLINSSAIELPQSQYQKKIMDFQPTKICKQIHTKLHSGSPLFFSKKPCFKLNKNCHKPKHKNILRQKEQQKFKPYVFLPTFDSFSPTLNQCYNKHYESTSSDSELYYNKHYISSSDTNSSDSVDAYIHKIQHKAKQRNLISTSSVSSDNSDFNSEPHTITINLKEDSPRYTSSSSSSFDELITNFVPPIADNISENEFFVSENDVQTNELDNTEVHIISPVSFQRKNQELFSQMEEEESNVSDLSDKEDTENAEEIVVEYDSSYDEEEEKMFEFHYSNNDADLKKNVIDFTSLIMDDNEPNLDNEESGSSDSISFF
ncbi:hypothetical protein GPJ56_009557 [Histomonas meleagridis]|uniref:uncharacterized protein n=1 Tax=Histomonas meleagridis TaxID=135588 RepID=UPI003559FA41|nr:hypothetical protein GPJ56_009557 [Histomonas meleagridis]KAH0797162.1 hypothetical protein GO595_010020 [Histomonas meleagridis]